MISPNVYYMIGLAIFLAPLALYDARYYRIPLWISVLGIFTGLSLGAVQDFFFHFWGFLLGIGLLGLAYLFTKPKMGLGDVMLAGLVGAFMGPWVTLFSLNLGTFLALIFALYKKYGKSHFSGKIPFAPFLALGSGVAWFLTNLWERQNLT